VGLRVAVQQQERWPGTADHRVHLGTGAGRPDDPEPGKERFLWDHGAIMPRHLGPPGRSD
jgi:hypothetical protein